MPTVYPGAIDNFTDPTAVDSLSTPAVLHTTQHTNVNDAVNAIETELGVNPKGSDLSVADRLAAIDLELNAKLDSGAYHQPFGVATLDGASKLVEEVDAAKMTSGTLAVARIPNLSGAKILGTGGGGAPIPVDAVPDLPASKTTSGSFDAARIPNLDAAKINSGVFSKARIPTDFGAAPVVRADIAGRDAISIANRTDGMMVFVRSPNSLWMWRDEIDKWQLMSLKVNLAASQSTPAAAAWGNVNTFTFPAMAGVVYGIDIVLFATATSSTPDLKLGWTFPDGLMTAGNNGPDTGSTNSSSSGWSAAGTTDGSTPLDGLSGVGLVANQVSHFRHNATFRCDTDGTVQFRFAQNVSDAVLPALMQGSRMVVESY